ncbi:MAG: hypothetical protein ACJAXA_003726 [Candidatus Aldehydirespiratoraceae bacterium]
MSCSSSWSTARRIHAETDRSSASAASRILARVSGGNLTGTNGTVALVDRMARPADDVWVVWSDRCGQFVERCRDA